MNTRAPLQTSLDYTLCFGIAAPQLQVCSIRNIVDAEVLPNVVLLQPEF